MDPAMEYEVRALGRQKAMILATDRGDSEVQEFYSGARVLVTGFSGFLGKQLVEKLLRSCPQIKNIYLLIREKKGLDIQTRLRKILEDPVFEALRKKHPKFTQKLTTIAGDTSELGLGLSEKDRKTITDQVNIIFHAAATTRFDETLKTATNTNVRGTRELLHLAKDCKKLQSLIYVSTAYSSATRDLINSDIHEKFYGTPIEPSALIDMVNSVDENILNDITPNLINGWPNTYTYSKRVSEELVRTSSDGLPLCIIRPTIVIGTYNEPSPGWIEPSCAYGASGVLIGGGLGLIHVCLGDPNIVVDMVPADLVNNLTIVAGWETGRRFQAGERDHRIYMMSSSARNPVVSRKAEECMRKDLPETIRISPKTIYYIFSIQTPYKSLAYVLYWLLHFIPAYAVDGVLLLMGKKPILNKVFTKAWKLSTVLSYFLINQWTFRDTNTKELYDKLSQTDKDIYNFDVTTYEWNEMLCMWILGIRKYIIKDELKDSEYAAKKQFRLKILHYFIVTLYAYLWWNVIKFCFWILRFVFGF